MTDDHESTFFSARRRDALRALGAAGTLLAGGRALAQSAGGGPGTLPACVLTPAQTEGPYFVDERLNRSDVRVDAAGEAVKPGALLTLDLGIASLDGTRCAPVSGATVAECREHFARRDHLNHMAENAEQRAAQMVAWQARQHTKLPD